MREKELPWTPSLYQHVMLLCNQHVRTRRDVHEIIRDVKLVMEIYRTFVESGVQLPTVTGVSHHTPMPVLITAATSLPIDDTLLTLLTHAHTHGLSLPADAMHMLLTRVIATRDRVYVMRVLEMCASVACTQQHATEMINMCKLPVSTHAHAHTYAACIHAHICHVVCVC